MNTSLSPVLKILHEVAAARQEKNRRVCELLSLDPTSTIGSILIENDIEGVPQLLVNLLEEVSQIDKAHKVQQNITDWPFENFWGNPHEPKHSKLLGYFINPKENHGCGNFLLDKLLEVLSGSLKEAPVKAPGIQCHFKAAGCEVYPEKKFIDLCIERKCDTQKFAIIIENKVNRAKNQDEQLETYVERVHARGFAYTEIYVFYLPLTSCKDPDRDDQARIEKLEVVYKKITFETHIRNWLDNVLIEDSKPDWPQNMSKGMSENLSHYRNLINYLVNKQKEREMNQEILKKLKKADSLPTLLQVEDLQKSATELTDCLKIVLGRKLLIAIQKNLQERNIDAWICLEDVPGTKLKDISPFDGGSLSLYLCTRAVTTDTVSVAFGFSSGITPYFGYMKSGGTSDEQVKLTQRVRKEAEHCLDSITVPGEDDSWSKFWYAYHLEDLQHDDNLVSNNSIKIADKLLKMRDSLDRRLSENY